jgi:hypothetical protein
MNSKRLRIRSTPWPESCANRERRHSITSLARIIKVSGMASPSPFARPMLRFFSHRL